MIPNQVSSAIKGLRFFRLMPKEDQPAFLKIISDWYKQPARLEDLEQRLKRKGFDRNLVKRVGNIVHKQQGPRAVAGVSPQFRRAVESEVRRLLEIKFGQGGDIGMVRRRLDQRREKAIDLYERLDGAVSQLLPKYKALRKQMGKKKDLRLDSIIQDLEQAQRLVDQLGSVLG